MRRIDFQVGISLKAGKDKFVVSNHARIRMFQRNVSTDDIKEIILKGEIIENYMDDEPEEDKWIDYRIRR